MDSSRVKAVVRSLTSIRTGMTIALSLAIVAPGAVVGQSPSPSDEPSHGAVPSGAPSPQVSPAAACVTPPRPQPGTVAADLRSLVDGLTTSVAAAGRTWVQAGDDTIGASTAGVGLAGQVRSFGQAVAGLGVPEVAESAAMAVRRAAETDADALLALTGDLDSYMPTRAIVPNEFTVPATSAAVADLRTALGLPQPCPAPEADPEVTAAPSPTPGPVASPFVALTANEAILRPGHRDVSFKRLRRLALKTYDANPPEVIPRDAWSWGRKWLVWNLKTVQQGHPKVNKAFSGRTERLRLLMPINSQRVVEWAYRQYLVTGDDSYLDVARHAYWYAETRFGKKTLAEETYVRDHIASLTPETAAQD